MMTASISNHIVRHFREVLFWPVQLMSLANAQPHWELLDTGRRRQSVAQAERRFKTDELDFEERHYKEFVTFLPYVQRFIYGESHRHTFTRCE